VVDRGNYFPVQKNLLNYNDWPKKNECMFVQVSQQCSDSFYYKANGDLTATSLSADKLLINQVEKWTDILRQTTCSNTVPDSKPLHGIFSVNWQLSNCCNTRRKPENLFARGL